MELRHLRYFIALADKLHFGEAAAQLQVSQSTLSHQIRQFEGELGAALFKREHKRVYLTATAQILLPRAITALGELDSAILDMKRPSADLEGEIHIGALPTLSIGLLPQVLAVFLGAHSLIKVVIQEMTSMKEMQRLLLDETLDIGLGYSSISNDEISSEILYEEQTKVVVRTGHPLSYKKKIRLVDLHRQKITFARSSPYREILDRHFRDVGVHPDVVIELDGVAALPHLLLNLNVAAIVPEYAVPAFGPFTAIPIERPLPVRTPSIYLKRKRAPSPIVRWMITAIRQIAEQRRRRR
jgi:LysR family cyn operon transcriptional activator